MAEQLHVKTSGEGDSNVVLLHGLFGSGNNLGQIARGLKGRHRVHSVDLPDHGRSDWLPQASIQGYAHCVADWMDDHLLTNCCVIGHSLGGKVAMQLAVNRPELIKRTCHSRHITHGVYRPPTRSHFCRPQRGKGSRCKNSSRCARGFVGAYRGDLGC